MQDNTELFDEFVGKQVKLVIDAKDHPIVLIGEILFVSHLFIKFKKNGDKSSLIALNRILSVQGVDE